MQKLRIILAAFSTRWGSHAQRAKLLAVLLLISLAGGTLLLNTRSVAADPQETDAPTVGGDLDTTFGNGLAGVGGDFTTVSSAVLQPDGKIVIAGTFTLVNGVARNHVARLNADGTLDTTFANGLVLTGATFVINVRAVAVQTDGKIVIGGDFLSVNGAARSGIARLNADGTLDTTFTPASSLGTPDVYAVAVQTDGKIVVGSNVSQVRLPIVRLNANGTPDTAFVPFVSGLGVYALALQTDGKIVIGGGFNFVNMVTRNGIARLNADGTLDTNFGNGQAGINNRAWSVALQTDGKVVVGGLFQTANGVTRNGIARFNADGTLDTAFGNGQAGTTGTVYAVAVQTNGKIVVGGGFININGVARGSIARLNADGALDITFGDGLLGADNNVFAIAVQPDEKIIIGGQFKFVNGTARGGIARFSNIFNVAVGAFPLALVANPVTNKVYVVSGSGTVTVIDGITNLPTTVTAGASPRAIALNSVTNKIYVANFIGNNVTVIDGANNSTTTIAAGTRPTALAVNSVTDKIYVANQTGNNVTVIDGANNSTTTVATGTQPSFVAVNPVTNRIYVANLSSNNVTVIDGANNATTTVAAGRNPFAVAVNSATNKIYVTNSPDSNVTVIDGANNSTTTVATGGNPRAVAVNPATNKIYVANFGGADVTVIDGANNSTTTIAVGSRPAALTVNPVTNKIYAANSLSNDVTVIDGTNNSTTTVAVGTTPQAAAVNSVTNKIYVANFDSSNVTVINGATAAGDTAQFSPAAYTVSEGIETIALTVTRTGSGALPAAVDFATVDGTATQRTRYIVASGTLDFAAGETTKTISIILEDNALVDGAQQFSVVLSNPQGVTLGVNGSAAVTINDNDAPPITLNPLETNAFFVRQQYYDFLARLPDMAGLDFWTGQITGPCGGNPVCLSQRRWQVSNAFFFEQEFQQTGSFVYRLYRAAYGNTQPFPNSFGDMDANPYCVSFGCPLRAAHVPSYERFVRDRARVVGGANLPAAQLAFGNTFTARSEFTGRYPLTQTAAQFVDALLTNIQTASGADLTSQRTALITLFNSNGRGAVLYRLAEDNAVTNPINNRAFIDAEYSRAFVLTQYFGYLRRDPDMPGLNFWLRVVNRFPVRSATGQNAMVCAFITSAEYQTRFSLITPRTDTECPTPP